MHSAGQSPVWGRLNASKRSLSLVIRAAFLSVSEVPMNMTMLNNRYRYGAVAQAFHWLTAVLVIAAYALSPGGSEVQVYSLARDFTRQAHETLGLAVGVLTLLRLAWQTLNATPEDPPMPAVMRYAAKIVHIALYVLLLAVPLTAIVGAWLEGHPVTLLMIGDIAPPLRLAHGVGQTIATIHTYLGDAIVWLAGLHAAAGLFHHFFLHDHVLRSMLPKRD
jgi:cytochrome b561